MHLIYSLLDVLFHEVFFLARGQLVDIDSFGDRALNRSRLILIMLSRVVLVPIATRLSSRPSLTAL